MDLIELGQEKLNHLLGTAKAFFASGVDSVSRQLLRTDMIGTLFYGEAFWECQAAEAVAGHLDRNHVHFTYPSGFTLSDQEILEHLASVSSTVDMILTSFEDRNTFGAGRRITEQFIEVAQSAMISLKDEVFAHPSALGYLALLDNHFDGLSSKRIGLVWKRDNQFPPPNVAQSIALLAPLLGATVKVVSPPEFELLGRIIKRAERSFGAEHIEVEKTDDLQPALRDVDAVIALNWSQLDRLNDIEGNIESAKQYSDWTLTEENLPEKGPFLTESPVRYGLGVRESILKSDRNLSRQWFNMYVSVLCSMIIRMVNLSSVASCLI